MNRPRVLLADDKKIVIEELRTLLEPEFELAGSVEDGQALVAAVKKLDPDVVVLDIAMPVLNGIEAAEQLKRNRARAKVIFLTMYPDLIYASRAFDVGASGYLLKHSASTELSIAIREALRGRRYVGSFIDKASLDRFMAASKKERKPSRTLTPRQRQVLQHVTEGLSTREIASVLKVSVRRVVLHKYKMMEVLNLHSHAELQKYAAKLGKN